MNLHQHNEFLGRKALCKLKILMSHNDNDNELFSLLLGAHFPIAEGAFPTPRIALPWEPVL